MYSALYKAALSRTGGNYPRYLKHAKGARGGGDGRQGVRFQSSNMERRGLGVTFF